MFENYEEAREWAKTLSYEELVDTYTDWGAMGPDMDCEDFVFGAVCDELFQREEIEID